jgi:SAM-dependent methyltransferase
MSDPEAVRRFEHAAWQRAASRYEASFAGATRPFVGKLLDAAEVRAAQSVLDVACGTGLAAAGAAGRGATARGVDFSPAMLEVARARHPAIQFDHGDAEALPYPDASFDAVVSSFGLHHVPRPVLALRETHRVLVPGGRVAFSVWAAPSENLAWKLVFDAIARCGDNGPLQAPAPGGGFRTPDDCRLALEEAGFVETGVNTNRSAWHHANGRALLDALRAGTARMGALIRSRAADAIPAIAAEIDRLAVPYRDAEGLAIPIAAYVAFGRKG